MKRKKVHKKQQRNKKLLTSFLLVMVIIIVFVTILILFFSPGDSENQNLPALQNDNLKENRIPVQQKSPQDEEQILAEGEGLAIVKANCTPCHSARLIVQNRATREGWLKMIRWMQQTQGLWDLGENEAIILDYLSKHYPPEAKGRRENLKDIEWYELK